MSISVNRRPAKYLITRQPRAGMQSALYLGMTNYKASSRKLFNPDGTSVIVLTVRRKVDGGWVYAGSWNVPRIHPYTGERLSTRAKRLAYIVDNFIDAE